MRSLAGCAAETSELTGLGGRIEVVEVGRGKGGKLCRERAPQEATGKRKLSQFTSLERSKFYIEYHIDVGSSRGLTGRRQVGAFTRKYQRGFGCIGGLASAHTHLARFASR